MNIEIVNKEVINVGKLEVKVNNKDYFILIFEDKELKYLEFYITEKDTSIISFCEGLQMEDITPNIEQFIYNNIEQWINFYNDEEDLIDKYYDNLI